MILNKCNFINSMAKLESFLRNGYNRTGQANNIEGFLRDEQLSGRRAQVYYNPGTGKVVVNHRGTQGKQDIFTDAKLFLAPSLYKKTRRYQHAKEIQQRAETKYGAKNITTVGHSLGARIASDVGRKSSKIVTYNKPVHALDIGQKLPKQETHIRTTFDIPSVLGTVFHPKNTRTIESYGDPISAHSTTQLKGGPIVGTGGSPAQKAKNQLYREKSGYTGHFNNGVPNGQISPKGKGVCDVCGGSVVANTPVSQAVYSGLAFKLAPVSGPPPLPGYVLVAGGSKRDDGMGYWGLPQQKNLTASNDSSLTEQQKTYYTGLAVKLAPVAGPPPVPGYVLIGQKRGDPSMGWWGLPQQLKKYPSQIRHGRLVYS
jgi:hypothetical protein